MNNYVTQIPWVKKVPISWKLVPLFFVADDNKRKNKNKNKNVLSLSYGKIIRRDLTRNFGLLPNNFDTYQEVDKGFIIIRSTDLQNDKKSLRVGLVKENGVITSAYIGLSPKRNVIPEYLFYYLNMCDLKKVFYSLGGGLRQSLRFEEFRRFPVILPSLKEQKSIFQYLDIKTKKIDLLIKKIEKKIKLLKEQNIALINQYVTRGLNNRTEFKYCGVNYIGMIPVHWKISKIKYQAKINNGSTPRSDNKLFWNGSIQWFTPGDFKNKNSEGYLYDSFKKITEEGLQNCGCSLIKQPSLLMTTRAPVGNLSRMDISFTFNQGCKSITPIEMDQNYLYFFLLNKEGVFNVLSNGTTFKELSTDNLLDFKIPLPPLSEQVEIAKKLNKYSASCFKNINLLKKRIQLIEEYRQSLISSVVTGKIQITEDML